MTHPETDYSLDLNTSYGRINVNDKSYDDHLIVKQNGTRNISTELSSGDVKINFK